MTKEELRESFQVLDNYLKEDEPSKSLSEIRGMDFSENVKIGVYNGRPFSYYNDDKGIHTASYAGEQIAHCVCISDFKDEVRRFFKKLKKEVKDE